jgi:hypothetical protein
LQRRNNFFERFSAARRQEPEKGVKPWQSVSMIGIGSRDYRVSLGIVIKRPAKFRKTSQVGSIFSLPQAEAGKKQLLARID